MNEKRTDGPRWDAISIRALRRYLEMTQQEMSDELGVRQQTISDWERGYHQPRGGMSRLLTIVAERVGYEYTVASGSESAASVAQDEASDTPPANQT